MLRPGARNGYGDLTVKTTAGSVTLKRPKLRGTTEQFRALERDGASGRLHGQVPVAVSRSGPSTLGRLAPLIAVPAQKLGDLGFEGGLQEQAVAEAGHLLQGVAKLALLLGFAEEIVDLGAGAVRWEILG